MPKGNGWKLHIAPRKNTEISVKWKIVPKDIRCTNRAESAGRRETVSIWITTVLLTDTK